MFPIGNDAGRVIVKYFDFDASLTVNLFIILGDGSILSCDGKWWFITLTARMLAIQQCSMLHILGINQSAWWKPLSARSIHMLDPVTAAPALFLYHCRYSSSFSKSNSTTSLSYVNAKCPMVFWRGLYVSISAVIRVLGKAKRTRIPGNSYFYYLYHLQLSHLSGYWINQCAFTLAVGA